MPVPTIVLSCSSVLPTFVCAAPPAVALVGTVAGVALAVLCVRRACCSKNRLSEKQKLHARIDRWEANLGKDIGRDLNELKEFVDLALQKVKPKKDEKN